MKQRQSKEYLREVSSSLLVLGLFLSEKPCEGDDIGVDLLSSGWASFLVERHSELGNRGSELSVVRKGCEGEKMLESQKNDNQAGQRNERHEVIVGAAELKRGLLTSEVEKVNQGK